MLCVLSLLLACTQCVGMDHKALGPPGAQTGPVVRREDPGPNEAVARRSLAVDHHGALSPLLQQPAIPVIVQPIVPSFSGTTGTPVAVSAAVTVPAMAAIPATTMVPQAATGVPVAVTVPAVAAIPAPTVLPQASAGDENSVEHRMSKTTLILFIAGGVTVANLLAWQGIKSMFKSNTETPKEVTIKAVTSSSDGPLTLTMHLSQPPAQHEAAQQPHGQPIFCGSSSQAFQTPLRAAADGDGPADNGETPAAAADPVISKSHDADNAAGSAARPQTKAQTSNVQSGAPGTTGESSGSGAMLYRDRKSRAAHVGVAAIIDGRRSSVIGQG